MFGVSPNFLDSAAQWYKAPAHLATSSASSTEEQYAHIARSGLDYDLAIVTGSGIRDVLQVINLMGWTAHGSLVCALHSPTDVPLMYLERRNQISTQTQPQHTKEWSRWTADRPP
ncbi:hypothetical protein Hypma_015397 [Hypsizygus marmoreus]|uniref:Uncharacterized protein n=1 Tax=Hypsizygus marmoreus TaxID=39966 RepID=A0A369KF73_HYPMA|nr:hypothetical protein Hypma_015397 [Hypsizygus marmoreus]